MISTGERAAVLGIVSIVLFWIWRTRVEVDGYRSIDLECYLNDAEAALAGVWNAKDPAYLCHQGPLQYPAGFLLTYATLSLILGGSPESYQLLGGFLFFISVLIAIWSGLALINNLKLGERRLELTMAVVMTAAVVVTFERGLVFSYTHAFNDVFLSLLLTIWAGRAVAKPRSWIGASMALGLATSFKAGALLAGMSELWVLLHADKGQIHVSSLLKRFAVAGCGLFFFHVFIAAPWMAEDAVAYLDAAFPLGRTLSGRNNIVWDWVPDELSLEVLVNGSSSMASVVAIVGSLILATAFLVSSTRLHSYDDSNGLAHSCALTGSFLVSYLTLRGLHPQFLLWIVPWIPALSTPLLVLASPSVLVCVLDVLAWAGVSWAHRDPLEGLWWGSGSMGFGKRRLVEVPPDAWEAAGSPSNVAVVQDTLVALPPSGFIRAPMILTICGAWLVLRLAWAGRVITKRLHRIKTTPPTARAA